MIHADHSSDFWAVVSSILPDYDERKDWFERTQEGKAIAKQRKDFREGRPPKFPKKLIDHALKLLETHSYKQVEEETGISKSTLIRAKKKLETVK